MLNKFSPLILGTWGLSGAWKNEIDENSVKENAKEVIGYAFENGLKSVDTAAVYGNGLIEEVIGELSRREELNIATKIPALQKPEGELLDNSEYYNPKYIHEVTEEILSRINRDRIDLLQLHNWHPSWSSDAEYFLEPLDKLKKKGTVKHAGISLPDNFQGDLNTVFELGIIDYIQFPYNPLQTWMDFDLLRKYKINPLVRSAFCQGMISTELVKLKSDYKEKNNRKRKYDLDILKIETQKWIDQESSSWSNVNEVVIKRILKMMKNKGGIIVGMNSVEIVNKNLELFLQ